MRLVVFYHYRFECDALLAFNVLKQDSLMLLTGIQIFARVNLFMNDKFELIFIAVEQVFFVITSR